MEYALTQYYKQLQHFLCYKPGKDRELFSIESSLLQCKMVTLINSRLKPVEGVTPPTNDFPNCNEA